MKNRINTRKNQLRNEAKEARSKGNKLLRLSDKTSSPKERERLWAKANILLDLSDQTFKKADNAKD